MPAGGVVAGPWADVGLPPTFVLDFLYLGWPFDVIAAAALVGALVAGFFWLKRRGVPWWAAGVLCVLVYGAANFGFYVYGLSERAAYRERIRQEQRYRRPPATTAPATQPTPDQAPAALGPGVDEGQEPR